MHAGPDVEIVITRTRLPVLRAGIGLLLLPMAAILSGMLYQFGVDAFQAPVIASLLAALGAGLGIHFFGLVAARISLENGALHILRSLGNVTIPVESIQHAQVWTFLSSRSVTVCIWRKESRLPVIAHFVVMDTTSVGDLRSTVTALEKILCDTGSQTVTEAPSAPIL